MKTNKLLIAAGFVLAGVTAAGAESAYEPTNAVPNSPIVKSERILQFNPTPAGVDYRKGKHGGAKRSHRTNSGFHKTNNTGFAHGYSTFEVLDSIH